jgi:hypothetical protein
MDNKKLANQIVAEYILKNNIEQLIQLTKVTWDGNLISKSARNNLVKCRYVKQVNGWNFITPTGIKILINLGYLKI